MSDFCATNSLAMASKDTPAESGNPKSGFSSVDDLGSHVRHEDPNNMPKDQHAPLPREHPTTGIASGIPTTGASPWPLTPSHSGAVAPSQESVEQITGAVAPTQETVHQVSGAVAPTQESVQQISGAVAPSQESHDQPKFSYAGVVARQKAAADAAAAKEREPATSLPLPMSRRKRSPPQLTLQTHHQLPDVTPPNHFHRLIHSHPWAHYVTLRTDPIPTDPECVTSVLPPLFYPFIKGGGYLSSRFVRSLFPRTYRESPSPRYRLPFIEMIRLEHAVAFREATQMIIDELLNQRYHPHENTLPKTPLETMPSVLLPISKSTFPVLYQVVVRGPGQGLTLEAKDFFIPGPDRRELHLIRLDQFATNVATDTRGFDRSLVSVKDFVWVYTVEPTNAALDDPLGTLEQARIPKITILDNRSTVFFRVKEFVFVTPPPTTSRTYGIILSRLCRHNSVKGLRIAFESAPEAVAVSPSVCDFPISEAQDDEFVAAHARRNVSCAMRFSEKPASKEARDQLCSFARHFLPAHPQEGLLPLKVFKLQPHEKAWLDDRLGNFYNYRKNPTAAQRGMAQVFNVACSALVAINCIDDDQRTHNLTATIPSAEAFPMRFDFSISDMSSERGWTNRHPVYLWIVGAPSLIRAIIQRSEHSYTDRSLAIRLVVPVWSHRSAVAAIRDFGTTNDGIMTVPISVKLGALPAGADPVYEIISSLQLFSDLWVARESRAADVLDTVYGDLRVPIGPVGPPQEHDQFSLGGKTLQLRPDQIRALQLGSFDLPVLAIQAAFGTGKTVIGALLAARTYTEQKTMVVATTTTNTAVAQFTDTLLRLDDYKGLDVFRFVCDSALLDGTPQTPVDIHTILKRLANVTAT